MANVIKRTQCPQCLDSGQDNLIHYSDGGQYCFACSYNKKGERVAENTRNDSVGQLGQVTGTCLDLPARGISSATAKYFDYQTYNHGDQVLQVANYKDDFGALVGQKIRDSNKKFWWTKSPQAPVLFGQHLWKPSPQVSVTITEGEIDALSVAQTFDCKYPVVSLSHGASRVTAQLRPHISWLSGFKEIILCFDQDETGRAAAQECIPLFEPGKLKIVRLPLKDANEMVKAGRTQDLKNAIYNATVARPDGVMLGTELDWDEIIKEIPRGVEIPFPRLDSMLHGLHKGRLTLLAAQPKAGKSTLAKEIGYSLIKKGHKVGNIFLEESQKTTVLSYIALANDKPLWQVLENPQYFTDRSKKDIATDNVCFYKHFGSLDSDNLLAKIEYMATALGMEYIILDHISIVISGQVSSRDGERKDIDVLMTKLRSLIERLGVGILAISHIRKTEAEELTMADLRGSGSLAQLSDFIVSLETKKDGGKLIRVLGNRYSGETGEADWILYDTNTGRMIPTEAPVSDVNDAFEGVI